MEFPGELAEKIQVSTSQKNSIVPFKFPHKKDTTEIVYPAEFQRT